MSLAALICAYQESGEPGRPLRATMQLAGRTLVERQARLAAAAGARPIVILVERMPPDLTAAIDRMRQEGLGVSVARSVADAADAVHPEDRLLLIADGLVADQAHVSRLAAGEGAQLLTLPDHGGDERFERIDSDTRWAGLATSDGAMLRETAAMLRDWDLQSTLLRRIVQAGAREIAATGEGRGAGVVIAEVASDLAGAESRIVASVAGRGPGWASRLLAPVEEAGTRFLMAGAIPPRGLILTAAALIALAAALMAQGWWLAGGIALLISTPLDGIAARLATLRLQPPVPRRRWRHLLPALTAAALIALAGSLAATRGWGTLALALATLAFLHAQAVELDGPGEASGGVDPWRAERKGMIVMMFPFALAGAWATGLGALGLYAVTSFFRTQRRIHIGR